MPPSSPSDLFTWVCLGGGADHDFGVGTGGVGYCVTGPGRPPERHIDVFRGGLTPPVYRVTAAGDDPLATLMALREMVNADAWRLLRAAAADSEQFQSPTRGGLADRFRQSFAGSYGVRYEDVAMELVERDGEVVAVYLPAKHRVVMAVEEEPTLRVWPGGRGCVTTASLGMAVLEGAAVRAGVITP